MPASKVMLIRHGEKPESNGPPFGVDANGNQSKNELIVRGWQRAGALARFFWPSSGALLDARLGKPTSLFAPSPSPAESSERALHTLGPLAALAQLDIDTSCRIGEEQKLAGKILKLQGVVLVAWEHKHIRDIVKTLSGGAIKSPRWPHERFDMVFVLTAPLGSQLLQVPQMLLAGDSADIFPDG
jgi:hypothetical protein